ncbi:MAG: calcium/sodium antiporter [Bacteroidales bacterium]|nr:calcium/sodium antiporter [Bacteroidales bacterium]
MFLQIVIMIVGLALVVLGANWLVDGASSIARRLGISEFVIGLTIVGFGTSMPEFVVSITGAIQGMSDVSIGNVIGSNVFNTLLILGLTAIITPIAITSDNRRRDIPIAVGTSLLLALYGMRHTLFGMGQSDGISRLGGIFFLLLFVSYVVICFIKDRGETPTKAAQQTEKKIARSLLLSLAGIGGLIGGGQIFVNSASTIAQMAGLSEKFIAITILAGGTSMPELVTCVVAAAKQRNQLALGNVLGSNIFNILLIIGTSATIHPIVFGGINLIDMGILVLSVVALWLFAVLGRRSRINRFEGTLLLLLFVAYYIVLFQSL